MLPNILNHLKIMLRIEILIGKLAAPDARDILPIDLGRAIESAILAQRAIENGFLASDFGHFTRAIPCRT